MRKTRFRLSSAAVAVAFLALASACDTPDVGASKVKTIKHGSSTQEALSSLGQGQVSPVTAGDSLRIVNGFLRQVYVVRGINAEVIWYSEEPRSVDEPITRTNSTPVLLEDGVVTARGWKEFDKKATELGIPNPAPKQ